MSDHDAAPRAPLTFHATTDHSVAFSPELAAMGMNVVGAFFSLANQMVEAAKPGLDAGAILKGLQETAERIMAMPKEPCGCEEEDEEEEPDVSADDFTVAADFAVLVQRLARAESPGAFRDVILEVLSVNPAVLAHIFMFPTIEDALRSVEDVSEDKVAHILTLLELTNVIPAERIRRQLTASAR